MKTIRCTFEWCYCESTRSAVQILNAEYLENELNAGSSNNLQICLNLGASYSLWWMATKWPSTRPEWISKLDWNAMPASFGIDAVNWELIQLSINSMECGRWSESSLEPKPCVFEPMSFNFCPCILIRIRCNMLRLESVVMWLIWRMLDCRIRPLRSVYSSLTRTMPAYFSWRTSLLQKHMNCNVSVCVCGGGGEGGGVGEIHCTLANKSSNNKNGK